MNRLMRTAVSIAILGTSAWLAGAAGAAFQSGMQCPTGRPTPLHNRPLRSSSTQHAYPRAARRDRLQEWRKRRQEWRAQRRWSVPRRLALRPEPRMPEAFGRPAWVGESPSLRGLPAFGSPQLPQGLDFHPPELRPRPFPGRFPAPPSFPDYPGLARFAPPPGYLFGYPPLHAYPFVPRLRVAVPQRATGPESVDPGQVVKEVHSRGQGYGVDQPDAANRSARSIHL